MVKLFIDSDGDFTAKEAKEWGATMICMPYQIGDKETIPYVDFDEFDYHTFYQTLRGGVLPTTSALNPEDYIKYFEPEFKKGNDIFYIHFSAAMTGTFNAMRLALNDLKEKYPERKFYEIDTKGITLISYVITREAVKLFNSGKTPEEIIEWSKENVDRFACYFFADDLKFFAKSGRVSGLAAVMGGIIGIRPIISIGSDGKMGSVGKVKGRANAINKLVDILAELGDELDKYEIVLGHCDALPLVEQLKEAIIARLGNNLKFRIIAVNPTAGSHCGPDTLGLAFRSIHR